MASSGVAERAHGPVTQASHGSQETLMASKETVADGSIPKPAGTARTGFVPEDIEYLHIDFHSDLPPLATPAPDDLPMPDLSDYRCAQEWSPARKITMMIFISYFGCYSALAAASYNSPQQKLLKKFDVGVVKYEIGSTLFSLGFAIAPMVLAPFSEIIGRRWIVLSSGVLFTFCQAMSGATNSLAGLFISRFFIGCGGSVFSALLGGLISDMYTIEELNTPMAIFSGATIFGTGYGPIICGVIANRHSWRWVFFMQAISDGCVLLYGLFFLKESRAEVLLSRKARALNQWYEKLEAAGCGGVLLPVDPEKPEGGRRIAKLRWRCQSDDNRKSLSQVIMISIYRPFTLLVTEPVVFFFSLWVSFAWGILFLTFSAIPMVFTGSYGFDLEENSFVFASLCVGVLISLTLSILEDKWLRKHRPEKVAAPEHRLYFACFESVLLPIGLFWFGWTSKPHIHWIVPTIGLAIATMGIFSIYLSCFNFLADCYGHYASSVLAAQSFLRNIFGGAFALVTHPMFKNMGYSAAGSTLGGCAIVLTFVPWALVARGPQIRASSKICSEIMAERGEK
ncbi:hypothetical protein KEM52_005817 [Ascosphaera acerosa]|nr:hypothetical protein KEM52_005817 [Ascosphaera acerosa]